MADPSGITRRTVTVDCSTAFETSEDLGATITATSTVPSLVWAETGGRIVSDRASADAPVGGNASVEVIPGDIDGWTLGGKPVVVDPASGKYSHAFNFTVQPWRLDGSRKTTVGPPITYSNVLVTSGTEPFDLDAAVQAGTAAQPVTLPVDFTGPQGSAGPQGDPGPKGDTGATGPVGPPRDLPSYVTSVAHHYDPTTNVYNFKPSNTRRLRAGLGRINLGQPGQQSLHLTIGDSLSAGCTFGTGPYLYDRAHAWPMMARTALAGQLGVSPYGTGPVRTYDNVAKDDRFTTTGTWNASNKSYLFSTVAGATLTFTTDSFADAVSVWFFDFYSTSFTISVNGATSGAGYMAVNGYPNAGTWRKVTLWPGPISPGATVKITAVSAEIIVYAVECDYTAAGHIRMANLGLSGATASGTGLLSWGDTATTAPLWAVKSAIGPSPRTVTDAAFTSGSTTFTSATAAFVADDVGNPLVTTPSARLVPEGTYIVSVTNATTAVLSQAATTTATGQTATLGRAPDCVHIELGANDLPAATPATVTAAITRIRNTFPDSDAILYIASQKNDSIIPAATWESFAAAMYALADALDVPLFDFRARLGPWSQMSQLSGDGQAHLLASVYVDLGRNVGRVLSS